MIVDLEKQLSEKQITIEVTNEARDYIGREGYDETYGARPLRRVIQNLIEDKLSDLILDGTIEEGNDVLVDFVDEEISISVITPEASDESEESNDSEVDGEKSPVA
jgi:ATP-dependent Clp protease ATP-binding subunit ClpA